MLINFQGMAKNNGDSELVKILESYRKGLEEGIVVALCIVEEGQIKPWELGYEIKFVDPWTGKKVEYSTRWQSEIEHKVKKGKLPPEALYISHIVGVLLEPFESDCLPYLPLPAKRV